MKKEFTIVSLDDLLLCFHCGEKTAFVSMGLDDLSPLLAQGDVWFGILSACKNENCSRYKTVFANFWYI